MSSRTDTALEYAVRHSGFPEGRLAETITQLTDPSDYGEALRLLGHIRRWQRVADPQLRVPVDAEIVSRTVVTNPWRTSSREALADTEAGDAEQSRQYRRATELLATFAVNWLKGCPAEAHLIRGVLVRVLLKAERGHDSAVAVTDAEWSWAYTEADQLIDQVRARRSAPEMDTGL